MALFTITTTAAADVPPNQPGSFEETVAHAGTYFFSLNDFTTGASPNYSHTKGNALSKIKIVTLTNVAGSFQLQGVDIIVGQEIDASDLQSSFLSFADDSSDPAEHTSFFTYSASDVGSNIFSTTEGTITVKTLVEVNAAPVIGDATETLAYGLTLTFTAAMFTTDTVPPYSDAEGDVADIVKITGLPSHGTLKYKGKPVVVNKEITIADITAGHLTFIGPTGLIGFGSGSFAFEIADAAGRWSNNNFQAIG